MKTVRDSVTMRKKFELQSDQASGSVALLSVFEQDTLYYPFLKLVWKRISLY